MWRRIGPACRINLSFSGQVFAKRLRFRSAGFAPPCGLQLLLCLQV